MAFFQYRAADHSGKIVEGVMEAEAEQSVVSRLHEMGCIPLRIALPGDRSGAAAQPRLPLYSRRKVSQQELLQFTRELSTLLAAGLPLDRSLSLLASLIEGEEFGKALRTLLEAVRAGKSLASAMGEHGEIFPKLYVNMIRAGETGGILEGVLRYLSEYLESTLALKEEIKSALLYPVILAAAAGLSLIVLFVYVIPRFSTIFKDVDKALPWITQVVIGLSRMLEQYGWALLLLIGLAVFGGMFYLRSPEARTEFDRLILRAPLLGDLVRKFETARFARTLSALLHGGVPLLEALGTVQGVVGNRLIARAIGQVPVRVREGKGMAKPLGESGLFPPLALNMIAVGEETGKLENMLAEVAGYYDQEVKRTTKRLTSLLEPALILGMGLVIGIVVISMLLAIFSINDLPF
ncbi:MAG TPA: type II secretion system F family protein [Candidatus Binatia bacterium]|nr:type II secretion system F family protein [Candidatus Binatia bacterium]